MRILDRYIFKSILHLFLLCLLTFFLLYIIADLFSHLDEILKHRVSLLMLRDYYLSYVPIIFVQITPIACLLAVLYTFGKLNRDNEVVAMRASGLSIIQITRTAIVMGVLLSAAIFWVNDRIVPQAMLANQRIKDRMENRSGSAGPQEREEISNLSVYGLKNRLFFINKFDVSKNTLEGIVILEHDERQNISRKIVASRGVYEDGVWRFYQSITYDFDRSGQIIGEPQYLKEEIMSIPESPADFLHQRQRPDVMNISQLNTYIWKLSRSGATTVIRNLKVELYQRFAAPLAPVIIILLGIPFALKMRRRATGLSSIGISIMVGFLYYVCNAVGIALGKSGVLTPFTAVAISPALAFIVSLYLIKDLP